MILIDKVKSSQNLKKKLSVTEEDTFNLKAIIPNKHVKVMNVNNQINNTLLS